MYLDKKEFYKERCTQEVASKESKADKPIEFKQDKNDGKLGMTSDRPRSSTLAETLVTIMYLMPLIISYNNIH